MTSEERFYWLAFSAFPGIGPLRFKLLLNYFGTAQSAWQASEKQLLEVGLGEKLVSRLIPFRKAFSVSAYQEEIEKKRITVLTLEDQAYPLLLKEIPDAPFVLYMRGTIPQGRAVGVVGTRKITGYGREITHQVCTGLVEAGIIVVSGLAYGVDTVAHQTAVAMGGKTIAVLGCGVDIIHPVSNTRLYWDIVNGAGCALSEYPPGRYADKGLFPARNRIISGLSSGIVVTEGTVDSGALITARYAAVQGREVFAIPGPVTSALSAAPTLLLKQGAKLVTEAGDIIQELGWEQAVRQAKKSTPDFRSPEEARIYELLSGESLHFDALVQQSGLSAAAVGSLLSVMEMEGKVISEQTGVYRLTG